MSAIISNKFFIIILVFIFLTILPPSAEFKENDVYNTFKKLKLTQSRYLLFFCFVTIPLVDLPLCLISHLQKLYYHHV